MTFQGKYDIIFDITKKGIIKMNIEEKLLQAKAEIALRKINNDFKKSDEEKDKLRKSALKVFNIEKNTVEEHK